MQKESGIGGVLPSLHNSLRQSRLAWGEPRGRLSIRNSRLWQLDYVQHWLKSCGEFNLWVEAPVNGQGMAAAGCQLTSPSCCSSFNWHHRHTAGSCPRFTFCPFSFERLYYGCGKYKEPLLPKGTAESFFTDHRTCIYLRSSTWTLIVSCILKAYCMWREVGV